MSEEPVFLDPASLDPAPLRRREPITAVTVLLSVLKRPWILIITLLVVTVPLILHLSSLVPNYMASARVMVALTGRTFLDEVAGMGSYYSYYESRSPKYYTSVLESRAFFEAVTQEMQASHPEMSPDSIRRVVKASIKYDTDRNEPGFLTIRAVHNSPAMALEIAQTALRQFQNRCIELQREEVAVVAKFVDEQITHIIDDLGKAEKALQDFIASRNISVADMQAGIAGELADLEKKYGEARSGFELAQFDINAYLNQINEITSRLYLAPGANGSPSGADLKVQLDLIQDRLRRADELGLSEADVKELLSRMSQLRAQMVSSLAATAGSPANAGQTGLALPKLEERLGAVLLEQTAYRNRMNYYQSQIEQFKREHQNLPDDILELAQLTRSKDVLQRNLDFMLGKRETARIRIAAEQGGVTVIDEPTMPEKPIGTSKGRKLMAGLLMALALGVGLCAFVDYLDNTVKEENDVRRTLGLPVFGTIPLLTPEQTDWSGTKRQPNPRASSNRNGDLLLTNFPSKSRAAEAYRALKISLQFEAQDKGLKCFVISSPAAVEGKSLTTSNLGISFAQSDLKTLLIDGDLRRSILHRYFGLERKPGLTDYLYQEASWEEVVRDTGIPNLTVLPAGSSSPNPAELLASQRMKRLMADLRDKYDLILVDSPPIMVCADSLVLGSQSDGMLLVAKIESTNLAALQHAADSIRRLDVKIIGVILNQAGLRFGLPYYYAYRYYKPYSYYGAYGYRYDYRDRTDDGEPPARAS